MNHSKNDSLCTWIKTIHNTFSKKKKEDKYAWNETPVNTFEDLQPALLTMDLLKSQRNWHRCNDHIACMRPEVVLQIVTERKSKAKSCKKTNSNTSAAFAV